MTIVPHGGYTTALLYRLATTHFAHTHPTRYKDTATPISVQLAFLRRTFAGPVTLTVEDSKLGARTSTIHVTLQQPSEKTGKDEVKVTGYITVSPKSVEVGITARTNWELYPPARPGSGPGGKVDLGVLGKTGSDGEWKLFTPPFMEFRKASRHLELFYPEFEPDPNGKPSVIDQWARFCPGGVSQAEGRWTNEALMYLVDMFPRALAEFDRIASSEEPGIAGKSWYPTVTLNVDLKKRLPADGEEWLYTRVVNKAMRDGRMDIEVVAMDASGEVVAVATQVGLVMSASRNVGRRQKL